MDLPVGDLRPEYCEYQDTGCDLYPSCLTCPLPRCRYDEGAGRRRAADGPLEEEIVRLRRGEGRSIREVAARVGLSERTIYRVLRRESGE